MIILVRQLYSVSKLKKKERNEISSLSSDTNSSVIISNRESWNSDVLAVKEEQKINPVSEVL